MKKLILAITLVAILIPSVIGTTIVAGAPANKPTEAWDTIVDTVSDVLTRIGAFPTANYASIAAAVEDIRTKVMGVESSLNTTDGKVEAVQASVDYLQNSVDDIQLGVDNATSRISCMASAVGWHEKEFGGSEEILAFEYDQVAHVSLTVDERWFGPGHLVWVDIYFGGWAGSVILIEGPSEPKTIEFDAAKWTLNVDSGSGTDVGWAYTVTYPANIAD